MAIINLTQNKQAIVDDEDLERVSKFKWQYSGGYAVSIVYAGRVNGKTKNHNYKLARLIMDAPKGLVVDHIDGNPLNNRRSNLQLCTQGLNTAKKANQKNNTSGFRGVIWCKDRNKWCSRFYYQHKKWFLGYFDDIREAARAYDVKAHEVLGEFAVLNLGDK